MFAGPFAEIALLVLLSAALGFAGLLLRQPLIVAFIAVGVLAGPDALGLVASTDFIETLSQISIAVLLFLVGLKLDVTLVRTLGKVAVATGLGQVAFTALIGFGLCLAMGLDAVTWIYVGVTLTFSSTIIIVKLLSDKGEIGALHGKVALGFLIVQDLLVVLCMVILSAVGLGVAEETGSAAGDLARLVVGGEVMVGVVALFIRHVADRLLAQVARSPELLVTLPPAGLLGWPRQAIWSASAWRSEAFLQECRWRPRPTAMPSGRGWRRCGTSCFCSSSSTSARGSTSMRLAPRWRLLRSCRCSCWWASR
jgi:predicted Kef-type K+ transport protein